MIRQGYENTKYVVDQIKNNQRRRRDQRIEERKAPERLWTHDKLNEIKQNEVVEKFYEKAKNTQEFRNEYDKQMERKAQQKQIEKAIDEKNVNEFLNANQKGVKEKMMKSQAIKSSYGASIREQLGQNEERRRSEVDHNRKAPEIINKLNQETNNEQAFHKSKKPIITKYNK